jgi:putative peptidoglycan lipid II flippase
VTSRRSPSSEQATDKPPPSGLARAALSVGGATLISRITGFIRDLIIAAFLGAGAYADIFVVAFRLPNLFRRLFAEGAFSAAFIPLYARVKNKEGDHAARDFASDIFSVLFFALLIFTALAQIFMPYFVMAIAQGFTDNPEKFDLTVYYTRIAFPYLLFMSLLAFYAAMLNAQRKFFAAAFAPVLLNVVLIGALLASHYIASTAADEIRTLDYLIWGVPIAGGVQLIWVVIAAYQNGLTIELRWPRLSPKIRRVWALSIPGILASGIGQINLLIGTSIATAQAGAASWLYYADRLYQLPMGVIGVALGVALLPDLARRLSSEDLSGAQDAQNSAIIMAMLFTIPAAVGLFVLAEPTVQILFERGAFTPSDRVATAVALQAFCFGLPAFVLIKTLQPAFFAREDTRSPMIDGAWGVALNISLSLALFPIYGHVAIAIATSLAGWLTLILMSVRMYRRGYWQVNVNLIWRLCAQCLASLGMALAIWGVLIWLPAPSSSWLFIVWYIGVCGGGAILFAGLLFALRGASRSDLARLRRGA